ncbi:hypothetical protein [Desulfofundulus australicus]|nr:hypothetical protein [Desulfofundulus australicus]
MSSVSDGTVRASYVLAAAAGPTMGTSRVASRARVARMAISFLDLRIQF